MRYLYVSGKEGPMHVARYNSIGEMTGEALCGIDLPFNRSINAPFTLGQGVCEDCEERSKP